jgi:hypothetical protein
MKKAMSKEYERNGSKRQIRGNQIRGWGNKVGENKDTIVR